MSIRRIAIISPYARSISTFRGHLIRKLVDHNIHVFVLAPDYTAELREEVRYLGAEPIDYTMDRVGMNPIREISAVFSIIKLMRTIKPDAIFGYNHKPVIYGVLSGMLAHVPLRYGMIEGLGFAFTPSDEFMLKRKLLRTIMLFLYRIVMPRTSKIFFLNKDDLADFQRMGIVNAKKAIVIGGIGVDLGEWVPLPPQSRQITFSLAARLLKEKGVFEFVEAARLIKSKDTNIRFFLLGGLDTNPGAIPEQTVRQWVRDGILEWPGHVKDIKSYLAETSVFVLPSYREGVPRSTQEAMAVARPIISTDVPGCRDTVIHGVNGFLVPPRDPRALIEAMERFILEPELIERMGHESRRLAEERFDVEKINTRLIEEMLLASKNVFIAKRFNHHD